MEKKLKFLMSYIHFKTAYNLNYDKIAFDGSSISVGQLKKLITEKAKFVKHKKVDFDLELTNADTKKSNLSLFFV